MAFDQSNEQTPGTLHYGFIDTGGAVTADRVWRVVVVRYRAESRGYRSSGGRAGAYAQPLAAYT